MLNKNDKDKSNVNIMGNVNKKYKVNMKVNRNIKYKEKDFLPKNV